MKSTANLAVLTMAQIVAIRHIKHLLIFSIIKKRKNTGGKTNFENVPTIHFDFLHFHG